MRFAAQLDVPPPPRSHAALLLGLFASCTGAISTGNPQDSAPVDAGSSVTADAQPGSPDGATNDAPFTPPPGANLSAIVHPGSDGRLVYVPDERGNTVPDFSYAGYRGGGVALPDVATAITVEPGSGDDRARIQAALDEVAARPVDASGHRGAVMLAAGEYEVGDTLEIRASGVVLRGAGPDLTGTVLIATRRSQHDLIAVIGDDDRDEISAAEVAIVDDYVPFGARSFAVEDAAGFAVGDQVIVHRPSTEEWISALGMDEIAPRDDGGEISQWEAGDYDLDYERTITAIAGNVVTVDAPIVNAIDSDYGRASLYPFSYANRIAEVGIEKLRLVSEYEAGEEESDEDHAWHAISLAAVEDAWVSDVTAVHLGRSAVTVAKSARRITIQDSQLLDPVSEITGGRRYSFDVNGSLVLVQRCHARGGRHDYVTGSRVLGPNVFLDSTAVDTHADIGPHHRWATGILFDNISGGEMNVQDRGNYGSGHGWAGAQVVFWNCTGAELACQRPPTAQNFSIGFVGDHSDGRLDRDDGYWEWPGARVYPRSLYLWQLRDRLGEAAVTAIASPQQLAEM